ncbi:MAG: hypothetical protein LUG19_13290, partial [Desulfovibrio sp.]|uniref:hypothetical protein n=1 Tax=Desulfovibrio sp. TaxID=885 RepID=UPI002587626E
GAKALRRFHVERAYGVGEAGPAATPERPQFTCGAEFRRRREICKPQQRVLVMFNLKGKPLY